MLKILCIEDEIDLRDFIAEILTDAGYDVASASNGQEGLELMSSYAPDLVVSDLSMPVMDGLQLLHIVREDHPQFADVPFILLTGHTEKEAVIEGFASGADDYLTKPIDAAHLLIKVAATLRQVSRMRDKKQAEHIKLYKALTASVDNNQRNEVCSSVLTPSVCLIGRENESLDELRVQLEHSGLTVTKFCSGRDFLESMDDLTPIAVLVSFFTDDLQGNLVARFAKNKRRALDYPFILLWPPKVGCEPPCFRNESAIDDFIILPSSNIMERIDMLKAGARNLSTEQKASCHA